MKRALMVTLAVTVMVLGLTVGESRADSFADYPDSSFSRAILLPNGIVFLFIDFPGDLDIFIHSVNFSANLQNVILEGVFVGSLFWLDFEGFSGPFLQFGVYRCPGNPCSFTGRVGTLLL
jgi:hypothetical protein